MLFRIPWAWIIGGYVVGLQLQSMQTWVGREDGCRPVIAGSVARDAFCNTELLDCRDLADARNECAAGDDECRRPAALMDGHGECRSPVWTRQNVPMMYKL